MENGNFIRKFFPKNPNRSDKKTQNFSKNIGLKNLKVVVIFKSISIEKKIF